MKVKARQINLISVPKDITTKAYNIIKEEIEFNLQGHPLWKVIAFAYLMGLDHGYATCDNYKKEQSKGLC